ncbi:MAG: hypothetical protein V4539_17305 [Bacteroidota bacterium]
MRRFLMGFLLLTIMTGCEKKIGSYSEKKVRIRFKNELPGNILDCKVKLIQEMDSVILGALAQGESSKYIEGIDFYKEGTDARPALFNMHYRLTDANSDGSYQLGMPTRVASATTQKLVPGEYTILIRLTEPVPTHFDFSFTLP